MKKVLYLLGELTDEDIDWLVQVGRREEISPGAILIREGYPVDTLYILLEGALLVSISALEGRQIAKLAAGDVVGEMSFIDAHPPSATVQTLEESIVLAIPRTELAQKLTIDVGFAARFYRALAVLLSNRLRGTVKKLGDDRGQTNGVPDASDPITANLVEAQERFSQLLQKLDS